jgi:hypothetical protein
LTDNLANALNYSVYIDDSLSILNGSVNNNTPTPLNLTALANGTHTVIVQATDNASNNYNSTALTINVDTVAPTVDITNNTYNDTWTNNPTPEINFALRDNLDSVLNYTVFVDGAANGQTGYANNDTPTPLNLSYLTNGTHTFLVEALDEVGYRGNSTTLTITIDTVNPWANITSPVNDTWTTDSTPEINFTFTDNLAPAFNYTIFVDGSANGQTGYDIYNNTPATLNLSTLANGTHTIIIMATDNASNNYNSSALTITVDTVAPTAPITSPSNGSSTPDTTPTVYFNLSDNVDTELNYTLYVNGASNVTGYVNSNALSNYTFTSNLTETTHTLIVEAEDEVGYKTNSTTIYFTIDTSIPNVVINIPTQNDSWTTDTTPEINFTLTDDSSSVLNYTIYLNGVANITGNTTNGTATSHNLSILTQGQHVIIVEAVDESSNPNNSTAMYINIDTTAPTINVSNSTNNSWVNDPTPRINFTMNDNIDATLNYSVFVDDASNGQSGANSSALPTYIDLTTLTNGTHTVIVEVLDEVGYRTNSTAVTISVDSVVPFANITSPVNGSWTSDGTPLISFNVSDNLASVLSYSVFVDGSANGQSGYASNVTSTSLNLSSLANGSHSVIVMATDNASNNYNSTALTISVDSVAPVSTINTQNDTWTSDETPEINFTLTDNLASSISYVVYVDGSANGQSGYATNDSATLLSLSALTNGSHSIIVQATDNASNSVNSTALTINVDSVVPFANITSPVNDTWTTDPTPEINLGID